MTREVLAVDKRTNVSYVLCAVKEEDFREIRKKKITGVPRYYNGELWRPTERDVWPYPAKWIKLEYK